MGTVKIFRNSNGWQVVQSTREVVMILLKE
jgi:hypothetical protein